MWTRAFWRDAIERAVKTAAQVLLTMLVAAQTNLLNTDWETTGSAAGMAALLSILTSILSAGRNPVGTASLVATSDADRTVETTNV